MAKFLEMFGDPAINPKGWEVRRLGEVVRPIRNTISPQKVKLLYVGLEHTQSGEIFLRRWGTSSEVVSAKYEFQKGQILYGKLRPYLDKAVIATINGICSTDLLVLDAKIKNILPTTIIFYLHTLHFIEYATSRMSGIQHPRISWRDLKNFLIPLPPIELQQQFAQIVEEFEKKRKEMQKDYE